MQPFLKASLAVAMLLGSTSAALAAPASQMLALNQPVATVQRTALPTCSRTVTANCVSRGSLGFGKTETAIGVAALIATATGIIISTHSTSP
jgi:hypothetical protein